MQWTDLFLGSWASPSGSQSLISHPVTGVPARQAPEHVSPGYDFTLQTGSSSEARACVGPCRGDGWVGGWGGIRCRREGSHLTQGCLKGGGWGKSLEEGRASRFLEDVIPQIPLFTQFHCLIQAGFTPPDSDCLLPAAGHCGAPRAGMIQDQGKGRSPCRDGKPVPDAIL